MGNNNLKLIRKIEQKYGKIGRSIYLDPSLNLIPKDHWCNERRNDDFVSERFTLFLIKIQTEVAKDWVSFLTHFGISISEAFNSIARAFSTIDLKKLDRAGFRGSEAGRGLAASMEKMRKLAQTNEDHPKDKNFLHNPPGKKHKPFKSNIRISR